MGINIYDNDSKHSKLVEDLKSLPKEKAPDNFEFNLMARIQNKNFGNLKEEKSQFNIIKFLAPSAVVVTALIVFFMFFLPNQQQIDNPLMSDPSAILSDSQGGISNSGNTAMNKTPASTSSKITEPVLSKQNRNNLNAVVKPNDVVVKPSNKYPIFRNRSVSLDDYISGEVNEASTIDRGNIVNGGEQTAQDFDGFLVRQKPDKALTEKYRAMIDSVKKAQMKKDSVKKALK